MILMPVIEGATDQAYRINLDGIEYLIQMKYSGRFNRWYLSLLDGDENPIHSQIRMVTGYRLLQTDVAESRPPGDLYVFGPDGSSEITLSDLGTINKFYYMTADEINALKPLPTPDDTVVVL